MLAALMIKAFVLSLCISPLICNCHNCVVFWGKILLCLNPYCDFQGLRSSELMFKFYLFHHTNILYSFALARCTCLWQRHRSLFGRFYQAEAERGCEDTSVYIGSTTIPIQCMHMRAHECARRIIIGKWFEPRSLSRLCGLITLTI